MSNQRYSPEFKDEAVRQILDRGYSGEPEDIAIWRPIKNASAKRLARRHSHT